MYQRCNNVNDKGYPRYGARGIQFMFGSVAECVGYMKTLPDCSIDLTVDRIDNNGHYAVGNLRFTTMKEQTANRRNTLLVNWKGVNILAETWGENPYMQMSTICKYVKMGMTGEEIIAQAWDAVANKRKGWQADRKSTRLNSSH